MSPQSATAVAHRPRPESSRPRIDPRIWRSETIRRIARRLPTAAAVAFLLIIAAAIVLPDALSPYDPLAVGEGLPLEPPSTAHLMGTDYLGRDLLSRVIHGTRLTFAGSIVAVIVGLGLGSLLGLVAGFFEGTADAVISRLVDVLLSIPGLLLSMVVVLGLGFGMFNTALAVAIASIAQFTRIMRSRVLSVKHLSYVDASFHMGARYRFVLLRHIFPNSFSPVLSLMPLQLGVSILWISALSFLGYGAPPPAPEWGLLVSEGRSDMFVAPWCVYFPALTIALSVMAINHISRTVSKGTWK